MQMHNEQQVVGWVSAIMARVSDWLWGAGPRTPLDIGSPKEADNSDHSNGSPEAPGDAGRHHDMVPNLTGEVKRTSEYSIGYGAFSDVFEGLWYAGESCPVQVAIKFIRVPGEYDRVRAQKRLNREIREWRKLEHPNIVKLHGTSSFNNDRLALVMPWYENGDCRRYVGRNPQDNILRLIRGIALGLDYLHSRNVVHGDLKASNILIDASGRAIIGDFGLSRTVEDQAHVTGNTTQTLALTLHWAAPEVLEQIFEASDNDKVTKIVRDKPSDIWSFGCIVYEVITGGSMPFRGKREYGIHKAIRRGEKPGMREHAKIGIPAGLWEIAEACWAVDPSHRPSISELVQNIERERELIAEDGRRKCTLLELGSSLDCLAFSI